MKFTRAIAAPLSTAMLLGALAVPVSAATKRDDARDPIPAPKLLTDSKIDWAMGSSEWVNLMWTSEAKLTNVKVTVEAKSEGVQVEYPTGQEGFTSLMVDDSLASNEMDFTSVKITTDPDSKGAKQLMVSVTWDYEGQSYDQDVGTMQLSNKKYEGEDFAIMTEVVILSSNSEDAEANWVEFNYKGLAPRTRNMKMTVDADVEIYHPQESFTSLHHDQTLHAGETDVARVWIDPDLIEAGAKTVVVNISYMDHNGVSKTTSHKIKLDIKSNMTPDTK